MIPDDDDDIIVPEDNLPAEGFVIGNQQRKILEQQGLFPRRVQTSARTHGYLKRELREHRRKKIAERNA
jgi:hypothetical protein